MEHFRVWKCGRYSDTSSQNLETRRSHVQQVIHRLSIRIFSSFEVLHSNTFSVSIYVTFTNDPQSCFSADEAFDGTYPVKVVVRNTGALTYIPPGIFKSTCKIDITWFPFDDQDCKMKFGSWTYNGYKVRNSH